MSETILVALITGAATGIPATMAGLAALRKASQAEHHVRPNGQGRVPEMNEKQLLLLGEIRGAVYDTRARLDDHIEDLELHMRGDQ